MKNDGQTNKQTNTATDWNKKGYIKFPRLAFLKISFANTHLAHLFLPTFTQTDGSAKAKEPNLSLARLKTLGLTFLTALTLFLCFDSKGQYVSISGNQFKLNGNSFSLDLSLYPKGIYFIQVNDLVKSFHQEIIIK